MSNEPIDLVPLLAPLNTGKEGAGVDLRADYSSTSPYQRLRDARSAARAEERARDAEGGVEMVEAAGWGDVLSVGQTALANQSKDMEVAAWMTEALVRIHGLPGLTAGAMLMTGLCDKFWDAGFPQPDEDGLEVRSSPIGGLAGGSSDGTVMQPLRRLPLFHRADRSNISLYLWDQVEQTATLDDARRKARYAAGMPELKALDSEARLDKAYLTGMGRQTAAAIKAWRELDQALEARFGAEAPSLRNVTALLDRMLEVIARLGGVEAAAVEEAAAEAEPGSAVAGNGSNGGGAALMTRDTALRELDRIADYFRRTEPHSPLAYTLDEAVRRGRMSLAELLAEVLPDAGVRSGMLARLGIRIEGS